jgi:hypothetical protein
MWKILLLAILAIAACDQRRPPQQTEPIGTKGEQEDPIGQRIAPIFQRMTELERKIERNQTALLDVTTRAFQRLDSKTGIFFVALDDVKPFLNGQRLSLRIGNPQGATYNGFKMKFEWGKADPTLKPIIWTANSRTKLEDSPLDLRAGSWTKTEVVLAPATAEELSYLEVSLETSTLTLSR